MTTQSNECVGILGLGIMGSAITPNLLAAGFRVVGYDPSSQRMSDFIDLGGTAAESARAVAMDTDIMISLLPSASALQQVICGGESILSAGRGNQVLIESSTLPLKDKLRARESAAPALTVLDCPLSGTGAQATNRDLLVYASGDPAAVARCQTVFNAFARATHDLGEFGNGSKMKFVANLLVAIHNVAAAEAMVLGLKAGLAAEDIYHVVGDGAGGSRMFSVRGPQMVANTYEPATMKIDIWQKDMSIIANFAADLQCPTPLLNTSASIYTTALAHGMGGQDTAAVCAVLANMANLDRDKP